MSFRIGLLFFLRPSRLFSFSVRRLGSRRSFDPMEIAIFSTLKNMLYANLKEYVPRLWKSYPLGSAKSSLALCLSYSLSSVSPCLDMTLRFQSLSRTATGSPTTFLTDCQCPSPARRRFLDQTWRGSARKKQTKQYFNKHVAKVERQRGWIRSHAGPRSGSLLALCSDTGAAATGAAADSSLTPVPPPPLTTVTESADVARPVLFFFIRVCRT